MKNEYFFDGVYVEQNTLAPDEFITLYSDAYNWCFILMSGAVMRVEGDLDEANVSVSIMKPGIQLLQKGHKYSFVAREPSVYLTIQGWVVTSPIKHPSTHT